MEKRRVFATDLPSVNVNDILLVCVKRKDGFESETARVVLISIIDNSLIVERDGYKRNVHLYLSEQEIKLLTVNNSYNKVKKIGKIKI